MVTLEQRTFYIATTLPYYALAFACFTMSDLACLLQKLQHGSKAFRIFKAGSFALLSASIISTILLLGNVKRDKELLADVYAFGKMIPEKSVIKVSPSLWGNWSLHGYFMRNFSISLYSGDEDKSFYLKEDTTGVLKDYVLWKKGSKMFLFKSTTTGK